jgi:hypothetical protein
VRQTNGTNLLWLAGTMHFEPVAHFILTDDLPEVLLHQRSNLNILARPQPPPAIRRLEDLSLRILAPLQRAVAAVCRAPQALDPRQAVYAGAAAVGAGFAAATRLLLVHAFVTKKRVNVPCHTREGLRLIRREILRLKLAKQHASRWPEGV